MVEILTRREAQVFGLVVGELQSTGCSPTVREVGRKVGLGVTQSHRVISKLVEMGLLRRFDRRARGLAVRRWRVMVPTAEGWPWVVDQSTSKG